MSGHLQRIIRLYEQRSGLERLVGQGELVSRMLAENGGELFFEYTISSDDIAGPFISELPSRIQDQRSLKKLAYLSVEEAIAERFHMDEGFLKFLNPGADFMTAGTKLKVANVGKPLDKWVGRIHADKDLRQLTAYDQRGRILGVYPASIGSLQTPSPRGRFTVRNKAGFPAYTLSPDNGFEPLDDGRQIVIAPGPNNPVGAAWIGLSEKTYGIHGTPEPSRIGLAESNGCIRLTNWDAMELARLVRTGVEVVID
jgi:lipoprotein-anchoring transpeptidase ErfK/SrfK